MYRDVRSDVKDVKQGACFKVEMDKLQDSVRLY